MLTIQSKRCNKLKTIYAEYHSEYKNEDPRENNESSANVSTKQMNKNACLHFKLYGYWKQMMGEGHHYSFARNYIVRERV